MFKSGDVVIITKPDDTSGGPGFIGGMEEYCGRHVTIRYEIVGYPDDGGWYVTDGGSGYSWAGNWMKKVNKFKGNK